VDLLAENHDVGADLWSATSFKALRDEALSVERHNLLHPEGPVRVPFVTSQLGGGTGPVVAVTDFMRSVPDQISRWVGRDYASLGTDGFGRSDTRERLREHFEVTAEHIVVCVLARLAALGHCERSVVNDAIKHYELATEMTDPWSTWVY
jgi:pyruvate dehydrogenase E1 component